MRDIIAWFINIVNEIVLTCNQNIVLQWTLYVFAFFGLVGAFRGLWQVVSSTFAGGKEKW